ncbi:MAG: phosphoribosylglycinamide formyltransferase [Chloroflexota bacterium]|nr:MAG: phosphoribosylglycinamide formyltransferase [Chloroflexota bacterium]
MISHNARLVVLASGHGSNLQAILDACSAGEIPARVAAVISDREKAYALDRARNAGIPAIYFPWGPYRQAGKDRQAYDSDLADLVLTYNPDWVILAGWMRLLGNSFLGRFPMQVVNLHPALPGTFPGTNGIERAWEAYQNGEIQHTGVMVHFVPDEGVDNGPLIACETVPIQPGDSLETLASRIHAVEHRLLTAAIRSLIIKSPLPVQRTENNKGD